MRKSIERRLAAAERRISSKENSLQIIVVHGGFSGTPRYADGGGRIWKRAVDETLESFEQRVIIDAKAAGLKLVIIGGLPPPGVDLGEEFLNDYKFSDVPPAQT